MQRGVLMSSRPGHRTLTLAMIVKDESERLPECLASVKPIVDEIVVVDTGSSDNTVQVARNLGARTFRYDWCDDFSAARNESLRHARGDWILMLDADEVIAESDLPRVRSFVDADGVDAVQFIVANYCDECESMWWTPVESTSPLSRGFSGYIRVPLVRMWRNRPEYRFRGCVHETIVESIREAHGRIAETDILIHHYGKGERTAEKSELYLRLGERNVTEQPDDPKAHTDLATQFKELGRWDEAEHSYRRALSLDPHSLVAQSGLVQVFAQTGRLAEAERVLEQMDSREDAPAYVSVNLAIILMKRGHLASAKEKLEAAVAHNPEDVVAHIYLGKVHERCADTTRADAAYRRAAQLCPAYAPAVAALRAFEFREQAGKLRESGNGLGALKLLKAAAEQDSADAMTYLALGSVLDSLGRTEAAYRMLLRAAECERFLPVVRQTLEGLARRVGRMDEAARVLASPEGDGGGN